MYPLSVDVYKRQLKHLLQHLWLNVGEVPRHVNPENGEEFSKVFNPFGIRVFVDPVEEWYVHQIRCV